MAKKQITQIKPLGKAHKIEARLAIMGISKRELSKHIGVSSQIITYKINSDGRVLTDTTILQLSEWLGVDPAFILDLDSWDGLLNPLPNWLEVSIAKQEEDQEANRLKRLTKMKKSKPVEGAKSKPAKGALA